MTVTIYIALSPSFFPTYDFNFLLWRTFTCFWNIERFILLFVRHIAFFGVFVSLLLHLLLRVLRLSGVKIDGASFLSFSGGARVRNLYMH